MSTTQTSRSEVKVDIGSTPGIKQWNNIEMRVICRFYCKNKIGTVFSWPTLYSRQNHNHQSTTSYIHAHKQTSVQHNWCAVITIPKRFSFVRPGPTGSGSKKGRKVQKLKVQVAMAHRRQLTLLAVDCHRIQLLHSAFQAFAAIRLLNSAVQCAPFPPGIHTQHQCRIHQLLQLTSCTLPLCVARWPSG